MEMELDVLDELQDQIDELDSNDPECLELTKTLKICQEMTYALAEGLIEMEAIEGEFHFFPAREELVGA